jgi:hypothetical protein
LRHIGGYRLAFAVTALTVGVTTVSAATAAGFAATTTGAAVRQALTGSPASVILVTAQVNRASAGAAARRVTGTLRAASRGLPLTTTVSTWSRPLDLAPGGPGGAHAQAQVISLPGVRRHARLVRGTWPSGSGGAGPSGADAAGAGANGAGATGTAGGADAADAAGAGAVGVAVPEAAARLLHLAPGQVLTLRDSQTGAPSRVRVTGIFRPLVPGDSYWSLGPVGPAGVTSEVGFTSYGPLVTTAAALRGGQLPIAAQAVLAVPDAGRITTRNLPALADRIAAADDRIAGSAGLAAVISTRLPALLHTLATGLVVARSQLLIGLLILLVIAGATLIVAVRLVDSQRAGEAPLLMARGASRRQLAGRGLAEAAALAVPAAVAGPLLGGLIVPLLTRYGPLAAAGIRLGSGQPAAAWVAAALTAAYSGVIIARPWLRRPLSPVQQRSARSRQQAIAATAAAGADLALIAVAAVASWQLAHPPASATGLSATIGVDPVLAIAPVLALAAGTLVMLRLLPLAARLADRAAARGRGLTFAAAAWQVSRRPLQQGGPALLAVLAVATSVLALATTSSWHRSVISQAGFAVGASTRVTLPPSASLGIGQVAEVAAARGGLGRAAARGGAASTPAVRIPVSLPEGGTGTIVALDGRAAASIVPAGSLPARGLAPGPGSGSRHGADPTGAGSAGAGSASNGTQPASAALLRELGPARPPGGSPLPGSPARIFVTARLSRAQAGSPALALQLTDAAGVGYLVPAGALPADGRPHRLQVIIGSGADYPLRLRGFSLQYLMPEAGPAAAVLTIDSVTAAGAALPALGPSLVTTAVASSAGAQSQDPVVSGTRTAGSRLAVTFNTGSSRPSFQHNGAAAATVTVTAGPAITALPGIATRAFLAATGHQLGSTISLAVQGIPLTVRLAGEVSRFPTVTGSGGGLILDQAALQAMLLQSGISPAPVSEWWLSGSGVPAPGRLPAGTSVTSSATVASRLRAQPLSAAGLEALLAVAVAALVLAGAGFGVSVAGGRSREYDSALLDALGARRRQVALLAGLEQGMLALPAAAAGLLLGVLLSHLVIPAVTLTAQAARPVPPVLVLVPLGPAVAIAALVAAVPPTIAALSGTRRLRAASRLRAEADA